MQILFNKTIDQCRKIGARGGRAHARNLRMRKLNALAGHSDFSTTRRYVHPQVQTVKEAIERARNGQTGAKPVPVAPDPAQAA